MARLITDDALFERLTDRINMQQRALDELRNEVDTAAIEARKHRSGPTRRAEAGRLPPVAEAAPAQPSPRHPKVRRRPAAETEQAIRDYFDREGGVRSPQEIMKGTRLSRAIVYSRCSSLTEKGVLERRGLGRYLLREYEPSRPPSSGV